MCIDNVRILMLSMGHHCLLFTGQTSQRYHGTHCVYYFTRHTFKPIETKQ